jgi:polar amino acid transport system substrate-binding protein
MHTSGYSLYRLKGTAAEWDGQAFNHLDGKKIASQLSFTITADMKALGAPVIETPSDPENIFRGLIKNYFAAAAVQTSTAEFLLGRNQEFADKIEKCSVNTPPFHQKPYYLMLSFALIEKYPEFSQGVLKNVEKIRESEAFKARSKEFFQQYMQQK